MYNTIKPTCSRLVLFIRCLILTFSTLLVRIEQPHLQVIHMGNKTDEHTYDKHFSLSHS